MKRNFDGWIIAKPDGTMLPWTFAMTQDEAWEEFFPRWDQVLIDRYWKRWDASVAAAKRMGYRFVRVRLVEVKR